MATSHKRETESSIQCCHSFLVDLFVVWPAVFILGFLMSWPAGAKSKLNGCQMLFYSSWMGGPVFAALLIGMFANSVLRIHFCLFWHSSHYEVVSITNWKVRFFRLFRSFCGRILTFGSVFYSISFDFSFSCSWRLSKCQSLWESTELNPVRELNSKRSANKSVELAEILTEVRSNSKVYRR